MTVLHADGSVPLTADEQPFPDADEDINARHALLRALHPVGYRDLRALKGVQRATLSFPADNLTGVDEFAERYHDWNVYVGVAPRVDAKQRDTEACSALYALFADQDFKDFASEAEARERRSRRAGGCDHLDLHESVRSKERISTRDVASGAESAAGRAPGRSTRSASRCRYVSCGSPRSRSAITFFWMFGVPPPITKGGHESITRCQRPSSLISASPRCWA